MKSKVVWIAGVAALAVMAAAGLHATLPEVEKDVRARVDKVLTLNGMDDVKATVSGQTVTLTAMDADPEAQQKLAAAKGAIAQIKDADAPQLPGGAWLNGPVTGIDVVTPAATHVAPSSRPAATSASAALDASPVVISGEKATSIDTAVSTTPPVAGDAVPFSRVASQACEEQIHKALRGRRVTYVQGTYDLTDESQQVLDDVFATMAGCPDALKLTVVAYTDDAGDAMAARLITQARAETAADALVRRGLPGARVAAVGKGASRPVASNATAEGREANRRVAFHVSES